MKQKVLLIEDYPVIQDLFAGALRDKGFTVEVAGDGEEALEMVADKDYDFILLDLLLPRISGIEFLEKFKDRKDTKVIVLSDFAYQKTVDKAYELGVDNYWIKSENTPSQLTERLVNYKGKGDRPKGKETGLA